MKGINGRGKGMCRKGGWGGSRGRCGKGGRMLKGMVRKGEMLKGGGEGVERGEGC